MVAYGTRLWPNVAYLILKSICVNVAGASRMSRLNLTPRYRVSRFPCSANAMCVLGVLKEKKGGFLGSEKKGRKISHTLQSAEYIRVGGGSRI